MHADGRECRGPSGLRTGRWPNKTEKWSLAALVDIQQAFPFPLLGVDSGNVTGSATGTCCGGARYGTTAELLLLNKI
jgi:hypothetical protein